MAGRAAFLAGFAAVQGGGVELSIRAESVKLDLEFVDNDHFPAAGAEGDTLSGRCEVVVEGESSVGFFVGVHRRVRVQSCGDVDLVGRHSGLEDRASLAAHVDRLVVVVPADAVDEQRVVFCAEEDIVGVGRIAAGQHRLSRWNELLLELESGVVDVDQARSLAATHHDVSVAGHVDAVDRGVEVDDVGLYCLGGDRVDRDFA